MQRFHCQCYPLTIWYHFWRPQIDDVDEHLGDKCRGICPRHRQSQCKLGKNLLRLPQLLVCCQRVCSLFNFVFLINSKLYCANSDFLSNFLDYGNFKSIRKFGASLVESWLKRHMLYCEETILVGKLNK